MNNLNNNAEDRFVVSDKDIKWGINGQQKTVHGRKTKKITGSFS